MGVRVSLSNLASAVANEGGIGTISSIGLGDVETLRNDYEGQSREALAREIQRAKGMTDGHIAVNFMGVLSNVEDLIVASVNEGVGMIVFGAGLPTRLPALVEEGSANLVPIISSARVGKLILRMWDRRYSRIPDGLILEGPLAGGHLGFSYDQLKQPEMYSLEILLPQVLETIEPYEDKFGRKIPVIVAGGIYDGKDIAHMLSIGASGVQMGTRFVCTVECDVSEEFKQAYLDSEEEDIVITKSPVGMPGRAIRNKFIKDLEADAKSKIKCFYRCLTVCDIKTAKYCIALALINAWKGDVDQGLIFCGQNAYRVREIVTVKELISELIAGIEAA
jgi:nitronate monooxygenase